MKSNMRHSLTAVSLAALLIVVGCKTTSTPLAGKAIDSLTGMHDAAEARLSTAAANAIAEGKTDEALAFYKKLYEQNRSTQDVALNYAQLLRKTGKAQEALDVLTPFTQSRRGNLRDDIDPIVSNEYAAANIETGNFEVAETLLNHVLEDKNAAAFHADAFNLLGVVLDAKGQHKEAEQNFRQALDGWKGDSTAVMNNLGLCLASEGLFDESLATLRQALLKAPNKPEIANNIQIVSDLRKSFIASKAATHSAKPAIKKKKKSM